MEQSGITAPPMANGELVFDAPWQGRVFGMARALCETGFYTWDEFREHLIAAVADSDREHEYAYYDHFLAALETLLVDKRLVDPAQLQARFAEFRERPHDHDHDH